MTSGQLGNVAERSSLPHRAYSYFSNQLRPKGTVEATYYSICFLLRFFASKLHILFLRARGYEIDFSVELQGGNCFEQARKGAIIIRKKCVIGRGVMIRCGYNGTIDIKERVRVHRFTQIDIENKLEIREDALIAYNCCIIDYDHSFSDVKKTIREQGRVGKGVTIGSNTWIGANVIVLKGVTIGNDSVVGAGSVVTQDIPANCVAAGVPARVIRRRT